MHLSRSTTLLLLFSCVATTCPAHTRAAHSHPAANPRLPFHLQLIGPNIWAAIDNPKGDAGANAGFVIGDDGVAVIDTFENEAAAKALLGEIRRLTRLPVKFVINTHYHLDHVAGNRIFANTGAVIIAHHSVRAWIHAENLKFFGANIKPEQKARVKNLVAPSVTYNDSITLYLGSRAINVEYFAGHTGGDSVVTIADTSVIFCGDLFWRKTLPNLIDATTSSWIATLGDLLAVPTRTVPENKIVPRAVFVPGHGEVGNAQDVQEFRAYLTTLREMVQKPAQQGQTADALVAAVLPELAKQYGSWNFFNDFARSNILDVAAELQGTKQVPLREKK